MKNREEAPSSMAMLSCQRLSRRIREGGPELVARGSPFLALQWRCSESCVLNNRAVASCRSKIRWESLSRRGGAWRHW
eukprot:11971015-Prorocentrum_lima.AAC.1